MSDTLILDENKKETISDGFLPIDSPDQLVVGETYAMVAEGGYYPVYLAGISPDRSKYIFWQLSDGALNDVVINGESNLPIMDKDSRHIWQLPLKLAEVMEQILRKSE